MKILFPVLILSLCVFIACDKDDAKLAPPYGESFFMNINEAVELPTGDHLHWKGVQENRCPKKAVCLWPGLAELTLLLNDRDTLPMLVHRGFCTSDTTNCGNQIAIDTDTLDLLFLYPYPEEEQPEEDEYEAKMVFHR